MTNPAYRILITKLAAELDHCQQLLMDDRRQRHPLADRARAALARWGNHPGSPDSSDGPAVPDGREPASVAMQPSDEEIMGLMPQQMHDDLAAAVRAMTEQEGIDSTPAKGVLRIILNRHVVDLVRAALARWGRQPAPPAEGEVPQGWHMLCDIEPEPGTMCDWVIMAQWGCDHGNGEWRHFDGSSVHVKGFAGKRGLMVSDPKLTAWRARPLPTTESQP